MIVDVCGYDGSSKLLNSTSATKLIFAQSFAPTVFVADGSAMPPPYFVIGKHLTAKEA